MAPEKSMPGNTFSSEDIFLTKTHHSNLILIKKKKKKVIYECYFCQTSVWLSLSSLIFIAHNIIWKPPLELSGGNSICYDTNLLYLSLKLSSYINLIKLIMLNWNNINYDVVFNFLISKHRLFFLINC